MDEEDDHGFALIVGRKGREGCGIRAHLHFVHILLRALREHVLRP